jgi:hypothetical protein
MLRHPTAHCICAHFPWGDVGGKVNVLARDDLWSGIIRTPTARLEKVSIRHQVRQAKVANLDVVVAI